MWLYESRTLPEVTEHRTDQGLMEQRFKCLEIITKNVTVWSHFTDTVLAKRVNDSPSWAARCLILIGAREKKHATDPRPASNQQEENFNTEVPHVR